MLHGGPGSGVNSPWTQLFDPDAYRVVLFDQRGCGRSTPSAAGTVEALVANTTGHLIADIESLRRHLGIDARLLGGAGGHLLLGVGDRAFQRLHVSAFGLADRLLHGTCDRGLDLVGFGV